MNDKTPPICFTIIKTIFSKGIDFFNRVTEEKRQEEQFVTCNFAKNLCQNLDFLM